jgi:hypothetical protein
MIHPPHRLTRRALLQGGAALLPLARRAAPARAEGGIAQVSLVLDGIGPGLDPDVLAQVVAPFLAAGLPVTCVADLVALTDPQTGNRPLCDRLAALALGDPGLFDIALPIGKLPRTERYFQLRAAGKLREAVVRAFQDGPAAARPFPVVTLVDRGKDPNIDHTAFRGAGFRIHLRAEDGRWQPRLAGRGELVASGGLWTRLDAPGLEDRVKADLATGQDLLLALDLGSAPPTVDLAARATGIATLLAGAVAAGRVFVASPAQLRLYAGAGLPVDVALLVDPGSGQEEAEAALAFVRDLATQGVPLTVIGRADGFGDLPGTVHFCARAVTEGPLPACLQAGPAPDPHALAIATRIDADPAVWTHQGVAPDGRLRLTPRQLDGASADRVLDLSPLEDHVIPLQAADLLQPVQRARLVQRFVQAAVAGQAYFHTIPRLATHLVEPEPVLTRLWATRRRGVTDPRRTPAPDAEERARLIGDARLAWGYVDRFTHATTGLCAGTVQRGAVQVINREATLWDLASQLHAIRAAAQLALIDIEEARARVRLMTDNLPLNTVEGLRLPPAMFRTDDLAIVTPGFDVCDAGRFLIALRSVVGAGLLDRDVANGIVAGWDLAGALPEGRPHSHLAGKWIDTTLSHCTPYIRRGLAAWGFSLVSPHPGLATGTGADRDIALLYDVAAIGQVGVEPVLLDLIELGPDRTANLIADVLFDAQLDWFEATGTLKCASEAPLNFAPWFSYQGLRFGHLGDAAWVVRGLGGAAEHDTPAFRAKAELLSTKSAFLWVAYRAHPWCDRLLQLIRDKTRIDGLGFSVGVFSATMQAMPHYSDLNTNGVILTAIGHALSAPRTGSGKSGPP